MKLNTRNWTATGGLAAVLVLTMAAPVSAQGVGNGRDGAVLSAVAPAPSAQALQQPGLPPLAVSQVEGRPEAMSQAVSLVQGQPALQPGLPPLAVSQIEDGRRSDALSQTFSLTVAEPMSIPELLRLLASDPDLSIVSDPDVDGTFTGELRNVTLRQALALILEPRGLTATFHDNIVRVRRERVQTRLFAINYVATRRAVLRGTGPAGVHGPGAHWVGGSQASVSSADEGDVFEEIRAGVETLLSAAGRMNLDRKAGLLQVTDYPANLDTIAVYVETYEARALRQVRIAATILEVELHEEFPAGIDWPLLLEDAGDAVALTERPAPAPGSGAVTIGVNIKDFRGLLEALAGQGRVNVMASPWVVAMNNEPAVMRVGTQDVFFVTTSQVDASSGRILQTAMTPQTFTEGIVLSVTPQIAADGLISMSIMPSVTERTGTATSRFGDQVPIVSIRETDTLVRVHEGETVVIAGLMQERTSTDTSGVQAPGDGSRADGRSRRSAWAKRKTDLVILLTPTVVARGGR